jgi:hypothetical protein
MVSQRVRHISTISASWCWRMSPAVTPRTCLGAVFIMATSATALSRRTGARTPLPLGVSRKEEAAERLQAPLTSARRLI